VKPTHHKHVSILVLTTLKMATRVAELRQWSLHDQITFIKPKCIRWSF